MRLKKRKKTSRIRGARTCGYGFRQKHKGHGNKGGFGFSGTGKRAAQKKQKVLMMVKKLGLKSYFGKQGFTSRGTARKKTNQINLIDIKDNYSGNKIELREHKILGEGEGFKAEIIAKLASKSAIEKMEKAGGKITILENKEEEKEDKKEQVKKVRKDL